MPDLGYIDHSPVTSGRQSSHAALSARAQRAAFLTVAVLAAAAGFLITQSEASSQAVAQAGPDLARLLRAMAAIKAMAAIGLVAITWWRLAAPITRSRLLSYTVACGAMVAGPGLIWGMEHLKLGAFLLHGGLIVVTLLLWRDPAMATRLGSVIAGRRARLRQQGPS